jgi:hypothetical protein
MGRRTEHVSPSAASAEELERRWRSAARRYRLTASPGSEREDFGGPAYLRRKGQVAQVERQFPDLRQRLAALEDLAGVERGQDG